MGTYLAGTIFDDRYKILACLAHGGMGQVYRAEHLALGKHVALKILGDSTLEHSEERFAREARAIARLDHPSCVRVLDYGRHAGSCQYIAMELLEGATLAQELHDTGPFSSARAVHIARSLLAALAHAHAHGVLHRDVKPENVIVVMRDVPRVVLIDFGLASLRDASPLTGSGMCLGSPSYIAPERLLGRSHDARTDIYSVGVILYELLAGARPFVGTSPEEIMRHALERPPRPLRAFRRDVAPALEAILRRALAKDPDRRYDDAEDMLSALDDLAMVDPVVRASPAPAHDDAESTMAIGQLAVVAPSRWSRLWSWVRYGRWRWGHNDA